MRTIPDEPQKIYRDRKFAQAPKKPGGICGDYIIIDRTAEATTAILADGIGTGIKAQVAAVMCASRLMELIRLGFTLREACGKIVDTMHEARTTDIPFSAFSVCRILNSGHATIMSYEIPSPILINNHLAAYLPKQRFFPMGLEMIAEVNCMLDYGDGIIMVSDGVSQAGLGQHTAWAGASRAPAILLTAAWSRERDLKGCTDEGPRQGEGDIGHHLRRRYHLRCFCAGKHRSSTSSPGPRRIRRKMRKR